MDHTSEWGDARGRDRGMKLQAIEYTSSARVSFTKQELRVLLKLAVMHYDGECQRAGMPGGFLWGLKNGNDRLNRRDADTLAKICEGAGFWERVPTATREGKKIAEVGRRVFGELLELIKGMEAANKLSVKLSRALTKQYQMMEREPYHGPLPYQGSGGAGGGAGGGDVGVAHDVSAIFAKHLSQAVKALREKAARRKRCMP